MSPSILFMLWNERPGFSCRTRLVWRTKSAVSGAPFARRPRSAARRWPGDTFPASWDSGGSASPRCLWSCVWSWTCWSRRSTEPRSNCNCPGNEKLQRVEPIACNVCNGKILQIGIIGFFGRTSRVGFFPVFSLDVPKENKKHNVAWNVVNLFCRQT